MNPSPDAAPPANPGALPPDLSHSLLSLRDVMTELALALRELQFENDHALMRQARAATTELLARVAHSPLP